MSERGAEERLGVAKLRAQQIIRLRQSYEDGEAGIDGTLEAIVGETQAILDDEPIDKS